MTHAVFIKAAQHLTLCRGKPLRQLLRKGQLIRSMDRDHLVQQRLLHMIAHPLHLGTAEVDHHRFQPCPDISAVVQLSGIFLIQKDHKGLLRHILRQMHIVHIVHGDLDKLGEMLPEQSVLPHESRHVSFPLSPLMHAAQAVACR